jgi:hypothetical protein
MAARFSCLAMDTHNQSPPQFRQLSAGLTLLDVLTTEYLAVLRCRDYCILGCLIDVFNRDSLAGMRQRVQRDSL